MRIIHGFISSRQKQEAATAVPPRGRPLRNFLRGKRGSTSVEFGLLAPILGRGIGAL
jgi:Flp pilus assembly protein TadG